MQRLLRKWDFLTSTVLAAIGAYCLPNDAVKEITTELIAFFSIQSAVILPAMIFTAGILKPDGLEVTDADRYHRALKQQMKFWVVLLALDFIAVVAMIGGKALNWSLSIRLPIAEEPIHFSAILLGILLFAGSLAVFRTIPFVRGVLSLLDLNSEMTRKAILRRNKLEISTRRASPDLKKMSLPEGFGQVVQSGPEPTSTDQESK